ncbi:hypothetical protein Dimus_026490, partial [Dionaea muscipula]
PFSVTVSWDSTFPAFGDGKLLEELALEPVVDQGEGSNEANQFLQQDEVVFEHPVAVVAGSNELPPFKPLFFDAALPPSVNRVFSATACNIKMQNEEGQVMDLHIPPKWKKEKKRPGGETAEVNTEDFNAFLVFKEDFSRTYIEQHPQVDDVKVHHSAVLKWWNLPAEEKMSYLDRVARLKMKYEKAMEAYDQEADKDA